MLNENQKKMQQNRMIAIGLSIAITAAIAVTVIAVVSARRSTPGTATTTTATTAQTTEQSTTKPSDAPVIAEKVTFIAPIAAGNVICAWSADVPVFSNTMEDYRVHVGTDIAAAAGTPVYAAADGTVESVVLDPMMGQSIILTHADGYKSVYRNLQTAIPDTIYAGAAVKAGDLIGKVGDTALVEIAEEPHLHFEIHKDGICENPMDYVAVTPISADAEYEDATS